MITFYKLLFLSYKVYDMSYIFDVKYKMNATYGGDPSYLER